MSGQVSLESSRIRFPSEGFLKRFKGSGLQMSDFPPISETRGRIRKDIFANGGSKSATESEMKVCQDRSIEKGLGVEGGREIRDSSSGISTWEDRPSRSSSPRRRKAPNSSQPPSAGSPPSRFAQHQYTRSPSQDFRLFGPSPWKILATTYEKMGS